MNGRVQRVCVSLTLVGFGFLFLALLVSGWFPIPAAHHSAAYIGRFYRDHTDGIRLGAVLLTAGAAMLAPIAAVLTVYMKRMEGEFTPLSYLQFGMGMVSPLAISIVGFFWWTAAYRPERDPVVTQSWNDAGWLTFTAVIFFAVLQCLAIATAIFTDRHERPLFPRWFGYLTVWAALLLFPSLICLFVQRGAFAWNGIASLYLAFVVFGAWFVTLAINLFRIIRRHELEAQAAA